ncbi:hypothetical protein HZ994_03260 [Akkermansiaceae bacterium]|nr:hypothetical protein HZ994_03260 [Akkermansiaceae bacterium]
MTPIPKEQIENESPRAIPGLPINPSPTSFSTANRRSTHCTVQRVYPWLLFASTAIAATFCLAYITKPVILAGPSLTLPGNPKKTAASSGNPSIASPSLEILPDPDRLPGDAGRPTPATAEGKSPASSQKSDFEETNIRVQHVLDAESANGEIDRIIVDVPVLYRSRNLRWTQAETEEARRLLDLLNAHQEKTRALRDEGTALLDSWNALMGSSIPSAALRADSPSLPANQFDPLAPDGAAATETIETIKLSNPEK